MPQLLDVSFLSLSHLSDVELTSLRSQLDQERTRRQQSQQEVLVLQWLVEVFRHVQSRQDPATWWATKLEDTRQRIASYCLCGESFVDSLGTFEGEIRQRLRGLIVSTIGHAQQVRNQRVSILNILEGLADPEDSFQSQLPGYSDAMLAFVLAH